MGSIGKNEGKRGITWTIDFMSPDGRRIRETYDTRKEAKAQLTARDYSMQQGTYEDPRKYLKFTLKDLTEMYVDTHKHQRGYPTGKKFQVEAINKYFGQEQLLVGIDYAEVTKFL
ncbi:MAG: hypothetical protein GY850_32230 [bacterium]|nr:hypothetical protein [bacterium]